MLTVMNRLVGLVLLASFVAGCAMVPNQDHGSKGCSNARGIGPVPADAGAPISHTQPVLPELTGKSPLEAATIAAGQGHTVVFNVQTADFGECWCVPPPEGNVIDSWWNQHGALYLQIDGVEEGHTGANQPDAGWGC